MNKITKRIMSVILVLTLIGFAEYGILNQINLQRSEKVAASSVKYDGKTPKYIFMFIGDGMSYLL